MTLSLFPSTAGALAVAVLPLVLASTTNAQEPSPPRATPPAEPPDAQRPAAPPQPAPTPTPQEPATTGTVVVQADSDDQSPHETTSTSGSKSPVPFLENNRRIDQFDQRTIRDRGAYTVTELLQYAPNVIPGERGTVRIRGFDVGQSAASGGQLFDGVRTSVYNLIPTNLYNVERVEILKGPAGVMYGQGQPGGVVNFVLKKPQAKPLNELSAQWDHWGEKQLAVDSTGPITEDEKWLYRVNVSTSETDTFRDHENFSNFYVAPAVSWQPTNDLTVSLLLEAFKDYRTAGRGYGTPVVQGDPFALPRNFSISDPDDYRQVEGLDGQLQVTHRLDGGVTLNGTLFGGRSDYENKYHEGMRSAAEDQSGNPTYRRQYRDQKSDTRAFGFDVHALWTGGDRKVSHRLLLGADMTRIEDPQFPAIDQITTNPVSASNPDGANSIDLNNPFAPPGSRAGYGIDASSVTTSHSRDNGFYGDYRIGFEERIFVNGGLRHDTFRERTHTVNRLTSAVTDTDDDNSDFSYGAGLVLRLAPTASLFYGYNEGFRPQGWTTVSNPNGPFEPLEWKQHEAGVSYESSAKDFGATLAVFELTRQHDLVPDTRPGAATGASIDVGETRSEGIELSFAGRAWTGSTVRGAYGYDEAYVARTTQNNQANTASLDNAQLAGVPRHTASLTLTQEIRGGARVFVGWRYVGAQDARLDKTDPLSFELPDYYAIDVALAYGRDNWEMRVGVDNVLDEDYVTVYRSPGHAVNRGEPRTLTIAFTTTF